MLTFNNIFIAPHLAAELGYCYHNCICTIHHFRIYKTIETKLYLMQRAQTLGIDKNSAFIFVGKSLSFCLEYP